MCQRTGWKKYIKVEVRATALIFDLWPSARPSQDLVALSLPLTPLPRRPLFYTACTSYIFVCRKRIEEFTRTLYVCLLKRKYLLSKLYLKHILVDFTTDSVLKNNRTFRVVKKFLPLSSDLLDLLKS